jgi:hypothetical protein
MNIKTKYNVGDVVMCVEGIGDGNLFSIRGLLPIARISIEVLSPKIPRGRTSELTVNIQYGFRKKFDTYGDFYWVKEKYVFTKLKEAPAILKKLGYSLDCEKERENMKGNDFPFLTLKEDELELASYDSIQDDDNDVDNGVDIQDTIEAKDIPF